ncbi:MAG: homocysteine S-methyltransferase family protein [Deltaproteobacteria bacterium]|nr:homocysteine S-methyltransferase family protein [Deltaproteobacteria bacterium]
MIELDILQRPVLLDGGMGRELRFRRVETPGTLWSALALTTAPEVVRQIHVDYIHAGADIITVNSYGIIRGALAREKMEDQYAPLNRVAGRLAVEAREIAGQDVVIAGSLPPLRGSFRPDRVGRIGEIEPLYREQAELLAPFVDLFICETMSTAAEAFAAARAACTTGKPVWVAWTLDEFQPKTLRSGETLSQASALLTELPVSGLLINCCPPERVTEAMPTLSKTGFKYVGGYANTFQHIPEDWELDGEKKSDGFLDLRNDLDPGSYAVHVADWLAEGATVVGGCCGTRPAHIKQIGTMMQRMNVKD